MDAWLIEVTKKSFCFLWSGSSPGFALITAAQKRYPVLLKRTPAQVTVLSVAKMQQQSKSR